MEELLTIISLATFFASCDSTTKKTIIWKTQKILDSIAA